MTEISVLIAFIVGNAIWAALGVTQWEMAAHATWSQAVIVLTIYFVRRLG